MDTLAFWLPFFFFFYLGTIGAVIKRRSCDHCLKNFNGQKVLVPLQDGEWICGKLGSLCPGYRIKELRQIH